MFPCRQTLSFVQNILLIASVTIGPRISAQLVLPQYYPSESPTPQLLNSLLTVASAKGALPDVLPAVQDLFPKTQGVSVNEATVQPLSIETPSVTFGSYPQGVSIHKYAKSNYIIPNPNPLTTYSMPSTFLSPLEVSSNSFPISQPITDTLVFPSQTESVTTIEQNYNPSPQFVQVENFTPSANVADVYHAPITEHIPGMSQLEPFIAVASPLSGTLPPQNIIQDVYSSNVLTANHLQTADAEVTVASVPIETSMLTVPTTDIGCYGQQLPVTLQINIASSCIPEPVISVVSPSRAPTVPSLPFDYSSFGMTSYPTIVMEKPRSRWKRILPLLLVSLFDGFKNKGAGDCCCQCGPSTPVPFPVVIPTNNPIICGSRSSRSRGKDKVPAASGNDKDNI